MPVQSVNSFGLDVAMSFSLLAVSRHSNPNGKARKFYYIFVAKVKAGCPWSLPIFSFRRGWMDCRAPETQKAAPLRRNPVRRGPACQEGL